jgi:hypothetical protein
LFGAAAQCIRPRKRGNLDLHSRSWESEGALTAIKGSLFRLIQPNQHGILTILDAADR